MNVIDFKTFRGLARKGNFTTIVRTVPADLDTPVSAFLKLAKKEEHAFLLESAEQEEKIGRYSIMGIEPAMILGPEDHSAGITEAIEAQVRDVKLSNPESLPGFSGGFVGYLAYENVQQFDTVHFEERKTSPVPQAIFFLVYDFVVFDHFRKTLSVVSIVHTAAQGNLKKRYNQAVAKIERTVKKLQTPLKLNAPRKTENLTVSNNIEKKVFLKNVQKIKSYIRAGDCIQVVLSQRFTLPAPQDDFQIYRALRSINPSPYMFYFKSGKYRLIGSSPEMLVKKQGNLAEVRPIAGTRPRGKTPAEDFKLEENLKKSIKETAEHLMLVDLGRNDLGRVCEFDSIRVQDYAHIERYSHVMHLVSNVVGRLKKGKSAFDLLRATFPAGTVSGAPKIRAMQIINELEPEERGPYAGCLGYFGFNHDMDMCITIRTLFSDGKKLYLQAGAGIVKDSNPEKEYEETLNKAKALLKAIQRRGEF